MPFTTQQFLETFSEYNALVGLWVIAFYAVAIAVLTLLLSERKPPGGWPLAVLGGFWIWMGAAYHWMIFTKINPAAYLFGFIFVVQGLLLVYAARAGWLRATPTADGFRRVIAVALLVYALAIYPLLGTYFGHGYPAGPVFGLPCPTTIFTFAILMLLDGPVKRLALLSAIPIAWAALGTSAATLFGIYEDYVLGLSALVMLFVLARGLVRGRRHANPRRAGVSPA